MQKYEVEASMLVNLCRRLITLLGSMTTEDKIGYLDDRNKPFFVLLPSSLTGTDDMQVPYDDIYFSVSIMGNVSAPL